MKFEIEWDSYHSDGRKRIHPPASTVHGWLTKMRGTLIDNESMRQRGIQEMKDARRIRLAKKKRNAERIAAGKPPIRPKARQPFLRLSFLRNRPKPISNNNRSNAGVARYKTNSSRPKSNSRVFSSSRKSRSKRQNHNGPRPHNRSSAHKRSVRPAAKKGGMR